MLAQSCLPRLLLRLPRLPSLPLLPRLRALGPGLAMSSATGTVTVQQPLNYRAGARVQPTDGGQLEEVFEPATGTGEPPGAGEPVCLQGPLSSAFPQLTGLPCPPRCAPAVVAELCLQRSVIALPYAEIGSRSVRRKMQSDSGKTPIIEV